MSGKYKKTSLFGKVFIFTVFFVILAGVVSGYIIWHIVFRPNVMVPDSSTDLFIPTGSDMHEVMDLLEDNNLINNRSTLEWLSVRKNYTNNVKAGRYRLREGMSNNELINMLRSGNQLPVKLVFISSRTVEDLASVIAGQIEADSSDIAGLAHDAEFIETLGFDKASLPALFIPNTYEFFWNTSAEQFYRRMKNEYERFWNDERKRKMDFLGLDRLQVSTLASIVYEETIKEEEMPVIAGVYINRLNKGIRLQADPTIKFAIGDFSVNRILKVHLEADSPYNTYKYSGLPPGPIRIPSIQSIDAVLNYQDHDYLYFCAREDFSGYHRFARTLSEHNRNARLYQNALNQRRVFR